MGAYSGGMNDMRGSEAGGGPHILVVDDDQQIRKLLGRYLVEQNFRVSLAADGKEAERRLTEGRIDLVVLDLMLPDVSGLDLCRTIRTRSTVPIILLTALKEDVDRIIGLEIGADDYLGKPFNPRELVARIRAVLRRLSPRDVAPAAPAMRLRFNGFVADPTSRQLWDPEGEEIVLTGAEFDLLLALLERPGRMLSREQLLDITHGRASAGFDRSVDVLISRLRRKLGDAGNFQIIKTLRNGGYQLAARVEPAAGADTASS